MLFVEATYLKY